MNKEFRELLKEKGRSEMPKVLLVSAECAPLAKTGGLADVVGTLPTALMKLGLDARVIMPYHRVIKDKYADKVEHQLSFYSNIGNRGEYVGLEKLVLNGVTVYLIDNEGYYGDRIYRGGLAEGEQYSFFCRAVLDAIPVLDFKPEIVHCNDWHTAIIPMLAHTQYVGGMQDGLKYLLSIHNIAYQGKYGFDFVQDMLGIDSKYYNSKCLEFNGCADYLKAGCVYADKISTVSPSYAWEIRMPYYSEGLDGVLNERGADLVGIINGINTKEFNPHSDEHIAAHFDKGHLGGKAKCKAALQRQLGLDERPEVPIFSMVTRMTEQKGFELILCVLDELMNSEDMQFVLLGSGDERFENFMRAAEYRHKGRLCSYIGYNDDLAHKIYAGSDFYLMPSRFEPCGLSQMIAMRYGTIPIVRETGGLRDTVIPYNRFTGEGDGFSFTNYDAWEMRDTVRRALECYRDDEIMKGLITRAMEKNFGFDVSAKEYAKLYICML